MSGRGTFASSMAVTRVPKLTDASILKVFDNGPSYMPSYKDQLTNDEKCHLVEWLRSRFGGGVAP